MINIAVLQPSFRQLSKLQALEDGWNFGNGSSPSYSAHTHATAIMMAAASAGAQSFEFFPEDDGGILVIAYRDDQSFEILAKANGGFEIAFEDGSGLTPAADLNSLKEVREALEQRGWQSPKSSDSFTRVILASEKADTHLLHLDLPPAAFRSSIRGALRGRGIPVVPMQSDITPAAFEDRLQYSGGSTRQNLVLATS